MIKIKKKKQIVVQKVFAQTEKTTYGKTCWLLFLSLLMLAGNVITIRQSYGKQLPITMTSLIAVVLGSLLCDRYCIERKIFMGRVDENSSMDWSDCSDKVPWLLEWGKDMDESFDHAMESGKRRRCRTFSCV